MKRALLAVSALVLAGSALAQPQSTASQPAQTPEALANQIKQVTDYLLEAQRWKKNAASGKNAEARRTQAKEAAAEYIKQRQLLVELLARMQLWAEFADEIDHEKTTLTDSDVNLQRQKELEALRSVHDELRRDDLHDQLRASPVSAAKKR